MKNRYTPSKNKEGSAAASNNNNNKVKTKDLYRSQVYSAKNAKSATLLLNKDVDREEQMAGIALLKKHEQALNRYQNAQIEQSTNKNIYQAQG